MLIIRDLMLSGGACRFEELREGIGISRNILTERLRKLVDEKVVSKQPVSEGARRHEYVLTEKGWDLMPLLVAMGQWGDKWRGDPECHPVVFKDRLHGQPIAEMKVMSKDGRPLNHQDMMADIDPEFSELPRRLMKSAG